MEIGPMPADTLDRMTDIFGRPRHCVPDTEISMSNAVGYTILFRADHSHIPDLC
ncbi:hypothetical protein V1278_003174 [Bradyrhizobium sp. AZCC 1577]